MPNSRNSAGRWPKSVTHAKHWRANSRHCVSTRKAGSRNWSARSSGCSHRPPRLDDDPLRARPPRSLSPRLDHRLQQELPCVTPASPCSSPLHAFSIPSPARAQFCPGVTPWVFDDVQASDPFCGFITWMANEQITGGCSVIDANHRLYCPNAGVTRTQMAAFMFRLGSALFPTTCAPGQVMKWNGTDWACANDSTAASSGTVTSIAAGTGLQATPNPITSSGSLAIAATVSASSGVQREPDSEVEWKPPGSALPTRWAR